MKKLKTFYRAPKSMDKEATKLETQEILVELLALQRKFSAQQKYSLLVVVQGMDAAGKDGLVRKVFRAFNPSNVNVTSFKKPTEEEYSHDFLWRIYKQLPKYGEIKVFNRSHYEDILVPGVYGYIDKKDVDKRFESINNFEKHLQQNNTRILKIFLNVSKDQQEERLNERLTIERKYWKHNDGDWETRERWDDFMKMYEKVFERCNKPSWNIVAADQNWYKEHQVAKLLLKEFKKMDLEWPALETEAFANS